MGNDYQYWSEANDIANIENKITELYAIWKKNPNDLKLNRMDLNDYCNEKELKKAIENLK